MEAKKRNITEQRDLAFVIATNLSFLTDEIAKLRRKLDYDRLLYLPAGPCRSDEPPKLEQFQVDEEFCQRLFTPA